MRRSPPLRRRNQRNAPRRGSLATLGALAACSFGWSTSCASPPISLEAPPRPPPGPGELRIELVFGAGADLDLYVTDPAQETVYYGNTPSLSGAGRLEQDLRCDAAVSPRVETIVFTAAAAGRYRVGVDRAATCAAGGSGPEPFLIAVEYAEVRRELRGEAPPGRFLPRVLELDLP